MLQNNNFYFPQLNLMLKKTKNLPAPKDHLCAKSVWISIENRQTHNQKLPFMY